MKKIILIIVLIGFFQSLQGQINGIVVNEIKKPLEAVYIYNKSAKDHAHTNQFGKFELGNAKEGDTLVVGLLGYEKKEILLTQKILKPDLIITLSPKIFQLEELVLTEPIDVLNSITQIDINSNPINSSQEILRKVPGLIIGQHAGGGKAEQIFLRGFDVDHGTDVGISVDGIPVNMVSHSHGQGYSDLHFLIPETIDKINFGKGPYYTNFGDFNTAGYINFKTKNSIDGSFISVSGGQFNTLRTLGMFDLFSNKIAQDAYLAIEYIETDGPFESPQNFDRLNIMGKYSTFLDDNTKLGLTLSHFNSKWDASGQIPVREVNNGIISNFGAIDDTEGGFTNRTNANIQYNSVLSNDVSVKTNLFYSSYNFELYSNFTFFLEDPINGDQIKQKENRDLFGINSQFSKKIDYDRFEVKYTVGAGLRLDNIRDVELSHTLNRKTTLESIQLGDVFQRNLNGFFNAFIELGKLRITPGLRLEYFNFQYNDKLAEQYSTKTNTEFVLLPKLNFQFNQNKNVQWFLKSGIGFHSNDARVVLSDEANKALPKAYGVDLGNIWKPARNLVLNTTAWYLFSEEEFVYVGDAGIVEPSGKSERYGLDLGLRYDIGKYLYLTTDVTLTNARSLEAKEGNDRIPLAPSFTMVGGISLKDYKNFSGSINYRYLDDRPANEDNSVIAEGYLVTDLNLNYSFNNHWKLGVTIENILDTDWKETQFLTESRLQNETQPVEEIHFTPGTPFNFITTLSYSF